MDERKLTLEEHVLKFIDEWVFNFHKKIKVPLTSVNTFFTDRYNEIKAIIEEFIKAIESFINKIAEDISSIINILINTFIVNPSNKILSIINWLYSLIISFFNYLTDISTFLQNKIFDWFKEYLLSFIILSIKIIGDISGSLFENILNRIPTMIYKFIKTILQPVIDTLPDVNVDLNNAINIGEIAPSIISDLTSTALSTNELNPKKLLTNIRDTLKSGIYALFEIPVNLISVDDLVTKLKD
jgi:hypothetical protein